MNDPERFGDLIVEFDVEYPNALNSDQKLYIKEALINTPNPKKHHQQAHHQNRKKPVADDDD